MVDMRVWLITGASRGMGTEFASAALGAGHAVVATGRRTTDVADALPASDRLLVAALDFDAVDDAREDRRAMGKNLDPRLPINALERGDSRIEHDGRGANLVCEAICGHTRQPGSHLHAAEPDHYT